MKCHLHPLAVVGLLALGCPAAGPHPATGHADASEMEAAATSVRPRPDTELVIRFYEDKLREHPTLFAGFAALGSAYLAGLFVT